MSFTHSGEDKRAAKQQRLWAVFGNPSLFFATADCKSNGSCFSEWDVPPQSSPTVFLLKISFSSRFTAAIILKPHTTTLPAASEPYWDFINILVAHFWTHRVDWPRIAGPTYVNAGQLNGRDPSCTSSPANISMLRNTSEGAFQSSTIFEIKLDRLCPSFLVSCSFRTGGCSTFSLLAPSMGACIRGSARGRHQTNDSRSLAQTLALFGRTRSSGLAR